MKETCKIVWLCNGMLPMFASEFGCEPGNKEGWLAGLSEKLTESAMDHNLEICVLFPVIQEEMVKKGRVRGIEYRSFQENIRKEWIYDSHLESSLAEILEEVKPDVIHLFGSEFAHSLALARVFNRPERTLLGLQGICFLCANHYAKGVPTWIIHRFLFRDMLRFDNIRRQQYKFSRRGEREKQLLSLCGHITGRTRLDLAVTKFFTKSAKYHFLNETLRSNFYEARWKLEECTKHSIFVSQGDYPLKGLHYVIEAVALLVNQYPDITLRVAGNRITSYLTLREKCKIASYGQYLRTLIRKKGLEGRVTFLGMQTGIQMCEEMKKSHVFVCASTMENSPNSLGEAMLLGMPCISSFVGGVPTLLTDGIEGICYQADEPLLLAQAICELFEQPERAIQMGEAARKRAGQTHSAQVNYERLMEIYRDILEG